MKAPCGRKPAALRSGGPGIAAVRERLDRSSWPAETGPEEKEIRTPRGRVMLDPWAWTTLQRGERRLPLEKIVVRGPPFGLKDLAG